MPPLNERNKQIVAELKDLSIPVSKIARDHGLSEEMIRQIGREAGVPPRKGRAIRPRRYIDREPVSPGHVSLGGKLARHRVVNQLPPSEMAAAVKISVPRLRAIELGCDADLTLVELQRLADFTQVKVEELIAS